MIGKPDSSRFISLSFSRNIHFYMRGIQKNYQLLATISCLTFFDWVLFRTILGDITDWNDPIFSFGNERSKEYNLKISFEFYSVIFGEISLSNLILYCFRLLLIFRQLYLLRFSNYLCPRFDYVKFKIVARILNPGKIVRNKTPNLNQKTSNMKYLLKVGNSYTSHILKMYIATEIRSNIY